MRLLPSLTALALLAMPAFAQDTTPQAPVAVQEAPAAAAPASQTPPAQTPPAQAMPAQTIPEAPGTSAPEATAPTPQAVTTPEPPATPAAPAPEAAPAAAQPSATTPADNAPATTAPATTAPTTATPAAGTATPAPVELEVPRMALSPAEMFLNADIVVKAVMVGLAFASVVTWTVFIVKLIELAAASHRAAISVGRVEAAADLDGALRITGSRGDPASLMLRTAAHELTRSAPTLPAAGQTGVKERVASHLDRIEARATRRITRGTGLLATVGSTAPFVGLFGTVWGIMNSFIGIAEAQTTNLSIVAPGIAEALLATGIGLVAAIPAVVIYNVFARATAGYRLQLGDASASVQRLVSRELDMTGVAP